MPYPQREDFKNLEHIANLADHYWDRNEKNSYDEAFRPAARKKFIQYCINTYSSTEIYKELYFPNKR